ncbi:MAG: hypothetical protein HUU48_02325 [Flavobacteriales bacterium]|nr:hypothetical protein [Flavobacteriales bacterium]
MRRVLLFFLFSFVLVSVANAQRRKTTASNRATKPSVVDYEDAFKRKSKKGPRINSGRPGSSKRNNDATATFATKRRYHKTIKQGNKEAFAGGSKKSSGGGRQDGKGKKK